MPKTHTPATRGALVTAAVADLPKLMQAATAATSQYGSGAPETLAAWEAVETTGATVHRQARLLAGKSRGG